MKNDGKQWETHRKVEKKRRDKGEKQCEEGQIGRKTIQKMRKTVREGWRQDTKRKT